MSAIRDQAELLKRLFRDRLATEIKEVNLREIYPDWPAEGEVWHFKPLTASGKERVSKLFIEGKYVEAQIESILDRGVVWDEDRSCWRRLFPTAMKKDFFEFDPEFLEELAARIGARWVDVMPREHEDPEKN